MRRKAPLRCTLIGLLGFCLIPPSMAQTYKTTFAHLGPGVPGLLYEPVTAGPKAEIAVLIMHTGGDCLTFPPSSELAKRGYRVRCANCSTSKSGFRSDQDIKKMVLNVKSAVSYLRL